MRSRSALIATVLVAFGLALAGCSSADEPENSSASGEARLQRSEGTATAPGGENSGSDEGDGGGGTSTESGQEGSSGTESGSDGQGGGDGDGSSATPPAGKPAKKITLRTSAGTVVVKTDPKAPKTVAAQSALARDGYFDETICHRVVTRGIFVLQCGDPTGTGIGDPGYALPDENLPQSTENNYPAGTVAMANAGPGTSGSQFFIVYKDSTLPPGYTVWGRVTDGLAVVEKIGQQNANQGISDGQPAKKITIVKATAD